MYIHVHDLIHFKLYDHSTYFCIIIDVNICMDTLQTRLYSSTTILHVPSGPISLATPANISSAQPPSCHQSFQLTDHPGVACHVQTVTAVTKSATRLREVRAGGTGPGQQRRPGAVTVAGSDPHQAHGPGRAAPGPTAEAAGPGGGGDVVGRQRR